MERTGETPKPPLRHYAREAIRRQIADTAIRMFDERGFSNVTIDEIVGAAGTSARTFHRYFASKDEAVMVDAGAHGELVRCALLDQTISDPWAALRAALRPLVDVTENDHGRSLRGLRVVYSEPTLRAAAIQKRREWADTLAPALLDRVELDDMQTRALVLGALACLDAALESWVANEAAESLGVLLDRTFAAIGYAAHSTAQ